MSAALDAFNSGFPNFLAYTFVAGGMLILASIVYVLLTPMKELKLLRQGNASAGLALGGVIIGLAIPISSALASSVSIWDLVFWGIIALLLQFLVFRFVDILLKDLPGRIENDEAGAAILLVAIKISAAMIIGSGLW